MFVLFPLPPAFPPFPVLSVPLDPDFAHDATGHFCQPLVDAWDCIQQAHIQSPCYKVDTATAAMLQSYSGLCPITFPSYTLTIDMWATSSIAVDQLPSELGGYKYTQQAYLCQQISSKINSVDLCSGLWAISKDGKRRTFHNHSTASEHSRVLEGTRFHQHPPRSNGACLPHRDPLAIVVALHFPHNFEFNVHVHSMCALHPFLFCGDANLNLLDAH